MRFEAILGWVVVMLKSVFVGRAVRKSWKDSLNVGLNRLTESPHDVDRVKIAKFNNPFECHFFLAAKTL